MLEKENNQFKEIIDELHRRLGKMVGGINKENWRTISGVREIIKRIEESKPISYTHHSIIEDS